MKKTLLTILLVLTLHGIAGAQAKQTTPNLGLTLPPAAPNTWGSDYNNNFVILDGAVAAVGIPRLTVATKPASPILNQVIVVTDALNSGTCTTGGGTSNNTCQWTGSTWVVIGGGTGGGVTDFSGLTGIASDAQIPDLNVLSTGLTGSRCVETTAGGLLVSSSAGCAGTTPTVVQTNQSNTYTTGDQNMAAAASFTPPTATGAAPTIGGRIALDSTTNRLKYGVGGSTYTFAHTGETQPLSGNLTALAGLTGANNVVPRFTGPAAMSNLVLPTCTATGTQAWNFDGTSILCGALSVGLTGAQTVGNIPKGATASTLTPSIMNEAAGVVTIGGGLQVGTVGPWLTPNTAALTVDRSWIIQDVAGTILPAAAAGTFTNNHVLKAVVAGGVVTIADGGTAGVGDVTLAGPNVMNNTTLDESAGNIIKITKSVQVELFGPTTDNTSGNGQYYFRVPVSLNGTNLVGIQSNAVTAGTTGLASVQITRCVAVATSPLCSGTTASMLSTVVSIDSGETSSSTAATAAVINTANDDVATGQILRFDVTAIHTTPAKGLFVNLDFKLP